MGLCQARAGQDQCFVFLLSHLRIDLRPRQAQPSGSGHQPHQASAAGTSYMAAKPVCVSYQAVPGQGDWDRIRPDIERQLPLKNLHWKSGNRSIRTIQSLSLDFRPLSSFGDEQPPLTLLERPYLHLLFVVCDVSSTKVEQVDTLANAVMPTGQRGLSSYGPLPDSRLGRLCYRKGQAGMAHRSRNKRQDSRRQVLPAQGIRRRQDSSRLQIGRAHV